jgi:hypothetical protein
MTIQAENTDGWIQGYVENEFRIPPDPPDPIDYMDAWNTSTSFDVTGNVEVKAGETYGTGPWQTKWYYFYRGFFEFDTNGTVPVGMDDILAVRVKLAANSFNISCSPSVLPYSDIRLYHYDWSSPITAINREANWDGCGAETDYEFWASVESPEVTTGEYYWTDLDKTWLQLAGATRYCLRLSNESAQADPTCEGGCSDRYGGMVVENSGNKPPVLEVCYNTPTPAPTPTPT